jgi:hypothetical protein
VSVFVLLLLQETEGQKMLEDLKDARLRGLAYYEAGARFALDDKVMKIDSVRLKETQRHQNGFDGVKEHILSAIMVKITGQPGTTSSFPFIGQRDHSG